MAIKRPEPGAYYGKPKPPLDDPEFRTNFPTLYEYLTQTKWDSGEPRLTATLSVFVDQGAMTVCLNDRSNNRSLFANEPALFACFASLEEALASDTAEWKNRRASSPSSDKIPW